MAALLHFTICQLAWRGMHANIGAASVMDLEHMELSVIGISLVASVGLGLAGAYSMLSVVLFVLHRSTPAN